MIRKNTPLERYNVEGFPVWVKRDDQCCDVPGPSLAKIRGVVPHLEKRSESVIGVLDTKCSKGGWAVAYVSRELGKRCIVFYPRFKADGDSTELRLSQARAKSLGADVIPLPAGRSFIMYHQARRWLRENFPDSYMVPNALKLDETITGNADEARATAPLIPARSSLILPLGTGTIASGVLRGLYEARKLGDLNAVILYAGYACDQGRVFDYIRKHSGIPHEELRNVGVIDEGWKYGSESRVPTPFPASPRYEGKAWAWMLENIRSLSSPVIFWNSGD